MVCLEKKKERQREREREIKEERERKKEREKERKKERKNAFTRKERPNCGIPKTVMKKKARRRCKKKKSKVIFFQSKTDLIMKPNILQKLLLHLFLGLLSMQSLKKFNEEIAYLNVLTTPLQWS